MDYEQAAAVSIARVCYEVNRAYDGTISPVKPIEWDKAANAVKQGYVAGVMYFMRNPGKTPKDQHEFWMETKRLDGWVHGEVKDAEKKTHPCMIPYDQLPKEQQVKDVLFQAVITGILTTPA